LLERMNSGKEEGGELSFSSALGPRGESPISNTSKGKGSSNSVEEGKHAGHPPKKKGTRAKPKNTQKKKQKTQNPPLPRNIPKKKKNKPKKTPEKKSPPPTHKNPLVERGDREKERGGGDTIFTLQFFSEKERRKTFFA